MRKYLSFLTIAAFALSLVLPAAPASAATVLPLSQIHSGDLFRSVSLSGVYYMGKDGFRYVFPNDKIYFTWYSDFNNIKWISDVDMTKVQIGGNVTYRPGVKMIKVNSVPKTYAIGRGGTREWITSEAMAIALYGPNWNKMIDDLPDGYWKDYPEGGEVNAASDFSPAEETANASSVNEDKDLKEPIIVHMKDMKFVESALTLSGARAVKFVNDDSMKHTATADDLSWGTGTIEPGASYSRYFRSPGVYTYFCSYHPSMTATVIVQ